MKPIPRFLIRIFLLTCLVLPACAPRGVMKYKQINVEGRPIFDEARYEGSTYRWKEMQIDDASREVDQKIWWDNDTLDRRRVDSSQRYKFELLEGKCLDERGQKVEETHVWRVYDDQKLIYDASYCRVHKRTMVRESYKGDIDAESLPNGFDSAHASHFPNSALEHPRCYSLSFYSSLDWLCPECTDAETQWLKKHLKVEPEMR